MQTHIQNPTAISSKSRSSVTRASDNRLTNWARNIIENCRANYIDVSHPDAVRAADILGFSQALRLFTAPKADAMFLRVQGCFGTGRKR